MTASSQKEAHQISEGTGIKTRDVNMQERKQMCKFLQDMELARGIEPPTCGLQKSSIHGQDYTRLHSIAHRRPMNTGVSCYLEIFC